MNTQAIIEELELIKEIGTEDDKIDLARRLARSGEQWQVKIAIDLRRGTDIDQMIMGLRSQQHQAIKVLNAGRKIAPQAMAWATSF